MPLQENMKTRIHKKVMSELKGIMMCLALERTGTLIPELSNTAAQFFAIQQHSFSELLLGFLSRCCRSTERE
jgi:hypothetical protein